MRTTVVASVLALLTAATGCTGPTKHNLPPAQMLMEPGPGVGGPGPGVMMHHAAMPTMQVTSQLAFVGPEGTMVHWDVTMPGAFDSEPLVMPGRQNFAQGGIYRLKLTNIAGRPGVELYPTIEVGPAMPRTEAFLAHNAIPVQWTEEDFNQVLTGNFVTKVIYLPDPEYQELALAGVETLVSTRLDPGVDPIVEASRRGSILAVVRLGNKDLEMPGEFIHEGHVLPAEHQQAFDGEGGEFHGYAGGPLPLGMPGHHTTMPHPPISGVTAPQYGMPMSGTPIGLPGPPHIPLGIPAGLQKHVMTNRTAHNLPKPTEKVHIGVRQKPGFSYPKPASRVNIVERTSPGLGTYRQPAQDRRQVICPDGICPDTGMGMATASD